MPKKSVDKTLLTEAMQKVERGIFEPVDVDQFTDRSLAEAFNSMVDGVAKRNNRHLMRINESMKKIGDGTWIKKLFEIIDMQQNSVENLKAVDAAFSEKLEQVDDDDATALALVRALKNNIIPCIEGINEIVSTVSQDEELKKVSANKIEGFHRLLTFNVRSLMMMSEQADAILLSMKNRYDNDNQRKELAMPMISEVKKLTESFTQMSLECFNAGHHMYEISRIVDDARNDMFRYNSAPDIYDSLMIYRVDHLILTWRLYNHMQEYEMLRRAQVDNPEGCKLGLWLKSAAPEWVRETEAYERVRKAHEELHEEAIQCFDAKETFETETARKHFDEALNKLDELLSALEALEEVFRKNDEA